MFPNWLHLDTASSRQIPVFGKGRQIIPVEDTQVTLPEYVEVEYELLRDLITNDFKGLHQLIKLYLSNLLCLKRADSVQYYRNGKSRR